VDNVRGVFNKHCLCALSRFCPPPKKKRSDRFWFETTIRLGSRRESSAEVRLEEVCTAHLPRLAVSTAGLCKDSICLPGVLILPVTG
jgi:hypothetical protein